jgi:hypothetical protein
MTLERIPVKHIAYAEKPELEYPRPRQRLKVLCGLAVTKRHAVAFMEQATAETCRLCLHKRRELWRP